MDIISYALGKKGTQQAVTDYLDEHLTNHTNPPIDTSLTIAGAAADSKETGSRITDLKEGLMEIASFPTMDINETVAYSCPVSAITDRLIPTWELDDIRQGQQLYWNVDVVSASVHSADFTNLNIRAIQYDSNDTVLSRTDYPTTLTINANAVKQTLKYITINQRADSSALFSYRLGT